MKFIDSMSRKFKKLIKSYIFVFKEIQNASRTLLLVLIFSTLITGFIPIFTQYLLKIIISKLENNISFNNFIPLVAVYAFALIFKDIVMNAKEYINTITGYKLTHNIQTKLIEKIKNIEFKSFYLPKFQDSYLVVLQNSQNEPSMLVFSTVFIISLIAQLVTSCAIVASFNPIIPVFLILCTIPSIAISLKTKKEHVKTLEERSLCYRKIYYYFNILTEKPFVKELRIFGLHNFFAKKRNLDFIEYLNVWKRFGKKEFLSKFFSSVLPSIAVFSSILWIVFQVTQKRCSIANFVFYSGLILSLQSLFESIISHISQSYKSTAFINKFFDFLEMKNEIKSGHIGIKSKNNHTLEFRNVSFKYPNTKKYVLKNVDLKIQTGEQIALVGKNGCGKTTLINLILRIYDPTGGTVLLDGIDIKKYNYNEFLRFFSAIFQDYQQYSVKLYDYISFGNIKNSKDALKIKQAAVSATANNFIEKSLKAFESNLTTRFDKHGLELSGGQWQKLAIARTFFSDANMLIFDEPTSSLDPIAESKIYENIQKLGQNKMSVFVSHRMYSSKLAGRIIYIENGEIKSDGTHEQLMQNSAGYIKLIFFRISRLIPKA